MPPTSSAKSPIKTHPNPLLDYAIRANLSTTEMLSLLGWLGEQLLGDVFAKLEQGGYAETQVPLRRVFVDLPVTENPLREEGNTTRMPLFLAKFMLSNPFPLSQYCETELRLDLEGEHQSHGQRSEWSNILLIGGPGQGKSTLGQLACQLHRAALLMPLEAKLPSAIQEALRPFVEEEQPSTGQKRIHVPLSLPTSPLIPLRVVLPDVAGWLAKQASDQDGPPLLLRFLCEQPSAIRHKLQIDTLQALTNKVPFFLLLDGFDEVGATEDRQRIVAAARELLTTRMEGAKACVLATTRPQGYAGELAGIGVPLQTRYLAFLNLNIAMGYAKKLLSLSGRGLDEQQRDFQKLTEAAEEPSTRRLLVTPLQVTILTALLRQQGRVPAERWRLFQAYFNFNYTREVERNTYASTLLSKWRDQIEQVHQQVALLLQVEAEGAGGAALQMSRERLAQVVDRVLGEEEIAEKERLQLVRDILDAAEKRLVLLVEPEPGRFGFEIRSLQEFMAAGALTRGRDSAVEARFLQIAKASMFRNVTLFIASRFFSESSPLRDVLAGRICESLDTDPEDTLARITKTGALLALEALEEGAVMTQPKRTRALMDRALGLLDLPASSEHVRLARVVSSDTSANLQAALELRLGADPNAEEAGAAWVCVIAAADMGLGWAQAVGHRFWPRLTTPASVLRFCGMAGRGIGPWLASQIEAMPEAFPAELIIRQGASGDEMLPGWVGVLTQRVRLWDDVVYMVNGFMEPIKDLKKPEMDPPIGLPPPCWHAWILAERFWRRPSAALLADTLMVVAETLPFDKWETLAQHARWPFAASLRVAESASALQHIAMRLRRGELGDRKEWLEAEEQWDNEDRDDLWKRQIETTEYQFPWSVHSLELCPPLASIESHLCDYSMKKSEANIMMQLAIEALSMATVKVHRRRLSAMCLAILKYLTDNYQVDLIAVERWAAEAEDALWFLFPRPPCLEMKFWIGLVEKVTKNKGYHWMHLMMIDAFVQAPDRLILLKLSRLTANYLVNMSNTRLYDLRQKLQKLLPTLSYETPEARADLAILRVAVGSVGTHEVAQIVENISVQAAQEPTIWDNLLSVTQFNGPPPAYLEPLLQQVYLRIGPHHSASHILIQQMRVLLQSRRSGLQIPSTWDRLALPLPYPRTSARLLAQVGAPPASPVVIESLHLKDVRGIGDLSLKFAPPPQEKGQWIVLLGPNGAGKTTILRSLVLSLRNLENPTIWPKGTFVTPWCRVGSEGNAQITVCLSGGQEQITRIRANGSERFYQEPKQNGARLFPLFAYGCRRGSALGGAARAVDLEEDDGPEVATLFYEGAPLIHAETWLKEWDGDAPKDPKSQRIFEAIKTALCKLLDLTSVEIRGQKVWVKQNNSPELPLEALSDGYLTSAGWFLDLLARWIALTKRLKIPISHDFMENMTGLVLLDEIDLHLHPKWQIEMITRTRELLPKMSFMVTTHNPLTLVGAKAEEIHVLSLERGQVKASKGIETPILLTGGQLFSRYFGIRDIYPNGLGEKLQRYGFLSGFALRNDEEDKEMHRLKAELENAGISPGWEEAPRPPPTEKTPRKTSAKKKPA